MSVPLLVVLGLLGIGLMLHARFRQRTLPDPDATALELLAAEGADPSVARALEFGFYLPTPDAAERVRRALEHQGFEAVVSPEGEENRWACLAVATMVPDQARLAALRQQFTGLAAAERGHYVGWRLRDRNDEPDDAATTE